MRPEFLGFLILVLGAANVVNVWFGVRRGAPLTRIGELDRSKDAGKFRSAIRFQLFLSGLLGFTSVVLFLE
jgi:hypothetical protein